MKQIPGILVGAFSIADFLTALYMEKIDLGKSDRVVLSKGHASAALYAVLKEKGIIEDLSRI